MSAAALALVLLAALVHAGWNLAAKHAGGDARFAFGVSLLQTVLWAPLGVWIALHELPQWGASEWLLVLVSGALHVLYLLTLLRGYRVADLTVVYPLARGSGALLSALVALAVLDETLSRVGLLGVVGVATGVLLVAGGLRRLRRRTGTGARGWSRGVGYGLTVGAVIAAYSVVDAWGVKLLALSPIMLEYGSCLVRTLLLAPITLMRPATLAQAWRSQWRAGILVALGSPIAYVLVLLAVQMAPLSHVAPAREVSLLFAALLGGRLLGEGERAARLLGAALIAAGVLALALG